jgi:hypothetical protein
MFYIFICFFNAKCYYDFLFYIVTFEFVFFNHFEVIDKVGSVIFEGFFDKEWK